jgi:hypothetical protein
VERSAPPDHDADLAPALRMRRLLYGQLLSRALCAVAASRAEYLRDERAEDRELQSRSARARAGCDRRPVLPVEKR